MFVESSLAMIPPEVYAPLEMPAGLRDPSCTACIDRHNAEIKDRIKKVDKANQRLVQLLGERNNWFSAVTHELRTPLNIIVNYADSLSDGIFGELSADQKEAVAKILKANESLMHTVNDLLDLSKIEANAIRIAPVDIEYEHMIRSTVELVRPMADRKEIALSVTFEASTEAALFADPERTEQVLVNLINNAIKFTPEGGHIEVLVEDAYPPNTALVTSIVDSGPGIPKDAIRHLFQPYFQVDSSSTRNKGGTGLGLAICKALVERMGGSIEANNEVLGGANFSFTLPISPR